MMESWDIAPWVIATVAGPLVLGLALAYGVMRRGRRAAGRRSPDYEEASRREVRRPGSPQG